MTSCMFAGGLTAAMLFLAPAFADAKTMICQASVQDANGIAKGFVASDGANKAPVRAIFVFPIAKVVLNPKAAGYTLLKPSHLPPNALIVSTQYSFSSDGKGMQITLEKAEIDSPAFTRPKGAAQPLIMVLPGGKGVLREQAAEGDGQLSLSLTPTDGKSERGDIHVLQEERGAFKTAFDGTSSIVVGVGDIGGSPEPVYQTMVTMTDAATRKAMIAKALNQAGQMAATGQGCQEMN